MLFNLVINVQEENNNKNLERIIYSSFFLPAWWETHFLSAWCVSPIEEGAQIFILLRSHVLCPQWLKVNCGKRSGGTHWNSSITPFETPSRPFSFCYEKPSDRQWFELLERRSTVRRNGSYLQVPQRRSGPKISRGTSFKSVPPQFTPVY